MRDVYLVIALVMGALLASVLYEHAQKSKLAEAESNSPWTTQCTCPDWQH